MYSIKKITSNTVVDFAAEELKKYLRMMMPECGDISIAYDPTATEGFRLGLMSDFGLDTSEADDLFLDDILHIDVDGEGNGIIAGSNPRSVLLAVYRYLQENGCRWLYPGIDGEFIPMHNIVATKYHKMADCRFRGQCNEGAEFQPNMMETIDFTPKIGLNVYMIEFYVPKTYYDSYYNHSYNEANREPEPITEETALQWKRQCEVEIAKRGLQFHDMGHGWTAEPFGASSVGGWNAVDSDTLSDETRQYLAEINGKRDFYHGVPLNTNVCMSNPVVRQKMAQAVADYAENHGNVDYLHVWLADASNNHCECAECRKMTPSDWYLMIMNEIDEQLTARALDTRVVFISYVDTSWPATKVKLNNPKRFTLLLAPITRSYTEPVGTDLSNVTYPPFQHNQNKLFPHVDQYVKAGLDWKEHCQVNTMLYEYHFWLPQYKDLGVFSFSRIVYDDIRNYAKHGMGGLINDCSQRSFWPNGFAFSLYGQLQFDTSLDFDALKEDYFRHAYGEDWREVEALFKKLGEAFDTNYLNGKCSANPKIGPLYNPSMAEKLRRVAEIRKEYAPFVAAHKNMPHRAQTVSMRLLDKYLEYCEGLSQVFILKCYGLGKEAYEAFQSFRDSFGKYEVEIERYYDQRLCMSTMSRLLKNIETVTPDD